MKTPVVIAAMTASAMPMPIPAFAPVERPLALEVEVVSVEELVALAAALLPEALVVASMFVFDDDAAVVMVNSDMSLASCWTRKA